MASRIFKLSENDYGAWERRGMFRAFKAHPSAQKMNIAIGNDKIMPPCGIRSGREKADNTIRVAFMHFPHCLGDSAANFPTIRWVHPAGAIPLLPKAIDGGREEGTALGIIRCGTDIQSKGAM